MQYTLYRAMMLSLHNIIIAAQEHNRGRGRGRGRRGRGRGRGRESRVRRVAASAILWLPTTPDSDQAPPAPGFSASPGPILHLPSDPQPIHFFEQIVDVDILQLIVAETNR